MPVRLLLAAVVISLGLSACGAPPGDAKIGKVRLHILQPTQDQRLTARSLSIEVKVDGIDSYRLRYFLDGADQGQGDASFTIFELSPGRHTVDVELLQPSGRPLNPELRASVGFTSD